MAIDIRTLKARYIDFCKDWSAVPNKSVLSAFFKAEIKKSNNEESIFVIFLDELKGIDFHPLYNVFGQIDSSEIDSVDILQKSICSLEGESVLLLLQAVSQKLRVVDLQDRSFGKDFLLGLSLGGAACQVLNLKFSHFRKVNMIGKFTQMHTLNLDFSASLTTFGKDCFTCMPNLKCLSLCETKISNLWTTSASLANIPNLVELRFQSCLCCDDTKACPRSLGEKLDESTSYNLIHETSRESMDLFSNVEDELLSAFPVGNYYNNRVQEMVSESDESTDSEVDFSSTHRGISLLEDFTYGSSVWNGLLDLPNEIFPWGSEDTEESWSNSSISKPTSHISRIKRLSYHPSPICYEKHYREYLIASFPKLKILDNRPIIKADKDRAAVIYSENFEYLPYQRTNKESVVSILKNRETKGNKSRYYYSRSLGASKVGCTILPCLHPLSITTTSLVLSNNVRKFRPRQFEYHPSNPSLMAIGTLDGEVVVVNHESEKIVRYIPSHGTMNSVLGLCWLKKYPTKVKQLLAVDGRLHLDFGIPPTGSSQNYTRSYYMNERDYILSGSCDEHVVRICSAQTGRRLRDISLEGKSSGSSMFVQSLRGDPFRDFNLSVLAAYLSPSSSPEIVKVNMLTSKDADKETLSDEHSPSVHSLGGA